MSMLLLIFPYSLDVLKQIPWLLCVSSNECILFVFRWGFYGRIKFLPVIRVSFVIIRNLSLKVRFLYEIND